MTVFVRPLPDTALWRAVDVALFPCRRATGGLAPLVQLEPVAASPDPDLAEVLRVMVLERSFAADVVGEVDQDRAWYRVAVTKPVRATFGVVLERHRPEARTAIEMAARSDYLAFTTDPLEGTPRTALILANGDGLRRAMQLTAVGGA